MRTTLTLMCAALALWLGANAGHAAATDAAAAATAPVDQAAGGVALAPAQRGPGTAHGMMLAATHAGARLVIVGERGAVLLSDDQGATFRQAAEVPVNLTLTAVSFVDAREGWAVGHGGTVLHTGDGGEHWQLQHQDLGRDQPLFSVYFRDAQNGWATGLWSLLLATSDGGKSWTPVTLGAPEGQKRADLNLLDVFESPSHKLFITAEQGKVLSSDDGGKSWHYLSTGNAASLWSGVAGQGNTLLVAGLRGRILRSADGGANWASIASPAEASVTHLARQGGAVWAGTVDGTLLRSDDDGISWKVAQRYGAPITALLPLEKGGVLAFSKQGLLRQPQTAAAH